MTNPKIRDVIERAIAEQSVLRIRYRSYEGEISERDVRPLHWESSDKFRAYCYLRQEERSFRTFNILHCEPGTPDTSARQAEAAAFEARRRRLWELETRDANDITPEDAAEYRRLRQQLFGKAVDASQRLAASAISPQTIKSADEMTNTPPDTLRPLVRPSRLAAAPAPTTFTHASTAAEWNRLVSYYAECLKRENRQQHQIKAEDFNQSTYPLDPIQAAPFLEGKFSLQLQLHGNSNPLFREFIKKEEKVRGDRQLCFGYLWFTTTDGKSAPLLVGLVSRREDEQGVILEIDSYEAGSAALQGLRLTEDEIAAILDECEQLLPAEGESHLQALRRFMINRLSELVGQTVKPIPWNRKQVPASGSLIEAAALFWVSGQTPTSNLIAELRELSAPQRWPDAPQALKHLLNAVPAHSYPEAPAPASDPGMYVTPLNDEQRHAITAGLTEPVTVVTGPPGTGKSQMILNLILQAMLRGQTVLFASRNNQAVDVVMSRLQDELKMDAAVRTGKTSIREIAMRRMEEALNRLHLTGPSPKTTSLREQYEQLKLQLAEAEKTLAEVRRLASLEQTYQAECKDLREQLKSRAEIVEKHAPGFNRDEHNHLSEVLARLRNKAVEIREAFNQLRENVTQLVRDNPARFSLIEVLRQFEQEWGSFGDKLLNPASSLDHAHLRTYLDKWLGVLNALELHQELTQNRRALRHLTAKHEEACSRLTPELEAKVENVLDTCPHTDLPDLAASLDALESAAEMLRQRFPSRWERFRAWLGLRHRVGEFAEKLRAVCASAGGQWRLPERPKPSDRETVLTVWDEVSQVVRVANLRLQRKQAEHNTTTLEARWRETQAALPSSLCEDVTKVEVPVDSIAPVRTAIKEKLSQWEVIAAQLQTLIERINGKLDRNADRLEILANFKKSPAGNDVSLWQLKAEAGPSTIVRHLTLWRNVVALWSASAMLKQTQRELRRLPTEAEVLAKTQALTGKLYAGAAEYIRLNWLEQVKGIPTAVIQGAKHYVSAVRQLLEMKQDDGYNPSIYRERKIAEERYLPDALRVFPVWATTNLSAKTNLPLTPGLFDLVIIDEASQCDIPSALPLLYRARRTVIVGDPMQLRHVATLYRQSDEEAAAAHGIAMQSYSYNNVSLFDLASRSAGNQPGTLPLLDHYRSHPEIISFSNEEFYGKLRIKTDMGRLGLPDEFLKTGQGLFWIHVPGQVEHPGGGSAINRAELHVIQQLTPKILAHLERFGLFKTEVGIVTPYRAQEQKLREWLLGGPDSTRLGNGRVQVGTAHKFQGDEKDIRAYL